jgi:hypothetical protein
MLSHLESATKLIVGSSVAIPAASLCINRRIYKMVSTGTFPITRREVRGSLSYRLTQIGIDALHEASTDLHRRTGYWGGDTVGGDNNTCVTLLFTCLC